MQRRALAFQIANIATFVTLDAFIAKLFSFLTKKPISGYRTVSLAQIIVADQALWQKASQETRGKILTSGDPKPVDKAVLYGCSRGHLPFVAGSRAWQSGSSYQRSEAQEASKESS